MAKFTLTCEFDSTEELSAFLSKGAGVDFSTEELATDTDEMKERKRRTRRTKAEMEAARRAEAGLPPLVDEKPVVQVVSPVELVREVPVELVAPIYSQPAPPAPPIPNFNFGSVAPAPIAAIQVAPPQPAVLNIQPEGVIAKETAPAPQGLPADLLGALSGSM